MRETLVIPVASLILAIAETASAQVLYPGQTYIGDPLADQHRYRMEVQRRQSADQAAFARQYQLEARMRQFEIQTQRQPEPYVPLVPTDPTSSDNGRLARERSTAQREATVAGVTQIDDWLARGPR